MKKRGERILTGKPGLEIDFYGAEDKKVNKVVTTYMWSSVFI